MLPLPPDSSALGFTETIDQRSRAVLRRFTSPRRLTGLIKVGGNLRPQPLGFPQAFMTGKDAEMGRRGDKDTGGEVIRHREMSVAENGRVFSYLRKRSQAPKLIYGDKKSRKRTRSVDFLVCPYLNPLSLDMGCPRVPASARLPQGRGGVICD